MSAGNAQSDRSKLLPLMHKVKALLCAGQCGDILGIIVVAAVKAEEKLRGFYAFDNITAVFVVAVDNKKL